MKRNRRHQHFGRLCVAALLAAFSVGCGTSETDAPPLDVAGSGGTAGAGVDSGFEGNGGRSGVGGGGGEEGDAGVPPLSSPEALNNNPIDRLFANPEQTPWDVLGADAQGAQEYVDAALACYADAAACDAQECGAFAACCVASGSCCEPVADAPLPESIAFDECQGQTVEGCVEGEGFGASVFGEQAPVLTDRGVVPNGSPTGEGGALIGDVVDLASQRLLVEMQFSLPVGCNGSCLQSAGVALAPQVDGGAFGGAEVGLLLSGSREVVNLLIGGQVADSFDAGNDSTSWLLVLSPSGLVEVERDGEPQGAYPFDSESLREARLAIFGRNLGADTNSAAVARIATQTELCDNPRGWIERAPVMVAVDGALAPELVLGREPSIAATPQLNAFAFELDGEIFIGEEEGPGFVNLSSPAAALFPTEPFEAGGLGDPELLWLFDSLYVFYTAYDANGAGSIRSAVVVGNVADKDLAPVLIPEGDVVSYEAPTVVAGDDLIVMVARATLQGGVTELRAFYSADPEIGWARVVDGALEELTRVDAPTSEVTSPSLIVHNSAYQLYYARRTGTRWTIELATSEELLLWRRLGEVLGASGEGFDSLGARGPDALSTADGVELVYMGQNGVSFELGAARRSTPPDTALQ